MHDELRWTLPADDVDTAPPALTGLLGTRTDDAADALRVSSTSAAFLVSGASINNFGSGKGGDKMLVNMGDYRS